jgi:predicted glycogen debranching enzyme
MICCFFSSFKTLLTVRGGYRPLFEFNVLPTATVGRFSGDHVWPLLGVHRGENATVVQYELREAPQGDCTLELRPLIAFRDYHSTTHENGVLNPSLEIEPGRVVCSPYQGCPNLYIAHSGAEIRQARDWYRNIEYSVEEQRGLDHREDLFNPMVMAFDLRRDHRASVVASTEARAWDSADRLRSVETRRRADDHGGCAR